jgi:hypothetical protein
MGWRMKYRRRHPELGARTQRSAISAFTRVVDALWLFAKRSGMKNAAPRPGHNHSSGSVVNSSG